MLHIVANVQVKAGNKDIPDMVLNHIRVFIASIEKNSGCQHAIKFYQSIGHENYRNCILPQYKAHRIVTEAIKIWKPTIVEAFKEIGGIGLKYIESDDAISVLAEIIGAENVVIVSSDKDMMQVPGIHYNPFKTLKKDQTAEDRWSKATIATAHKFLWQQVLSGDTTDMPNNLCGIEGVGLVTAKALLDNAGIYTPYPKTIEWAYTKKYGSKEGFIRANRTYKMVKLLSKYGCDFISDYPKAHTEMKILELTESTEIVDEIAQLFYAPNNNPNLFK
ncbi:hypothetical protein LCGC14_1642550 [marine sediment metagenome]|uniref:5'-3' exonuclease domain-containing protein n=1 Tax=marine sediment metagenome TaxID=412755 RepID=A0A0F9KF03_9ZZZZ